MNLILGAGSRKKAKIRREHGKILKSSRENDKKNKKGAGRWEMGPPPPVERLSNKSH